MTYRVIETVYTKDNYNIYVVEVEEMSKKKSEQGLQIVNLKLVKDGKISTKKIVDTPEKAVKAIAKKISSSDKEELWAIYLDTGCHILACSRITQGTVNGAYIYPREFFKTAILLNSTGVIAIHNHPGQTCTPSLADYEMVKTIIQAGQLLGIELFDHIIVCGGNSKKVFSFRKAGLFTQ